MVAGGVFSETLQSITEAKLSELSSKRAAFEANHAEIIKQLSTQTDPLARIRTLLAGVQKCFGIPSLARDGNSGARNGPLWDKLNHLDSFLEQAQFDPSLSGHIVKQWEAELTKQLDTQLERYRYATLYGRLVTEWLSPENSKAAAPAGPTTDVEMGESYDELPEKKRLERREQLERLVFTPADVEEDAIKQYLEQLFSDDESSGVKTVSKALTGIREETSKFETELQGENRRFNNATIARSIKALLQGELLTGEQRTVLKGFQNNDIIISEIADVLEMRFSALDSWTWGSSVPVEQRRRLNGRFDIYMHEDLLQAIFLQFTGTMWSVHFKTALKRFRRAAWKSNFRQISRLERKRREYYLGQQETDGTLARKRRRTYRQNYFLYQLLDSADQEFLQKDGDEEAILREEAEDDEDALYDATSPQKFAMAAPSKRKAAGMGVGGAMRHRKVHISTQDDEESDDGTIEMYATKKPMEKKQDLLHLLATEAAVNKRLHGSFAAFRSVFDDLQNSLSHEAVMTVLSFFGVSEKWQSFFKRYLEAPLRFLDDDEDVEPRKRKRGAPASHTLSDVFSETMLFCADFSVNRRGDGAFLYRLADDFWFWSHKEQTAVSVWVDIQNFAKTMALPINTGKSGSACITTETMDGSKSLPNGRIRWGMLFFDAESMRFKINQEMVDEHIDELKKQLATKDSMFDWIQTWNAYANTFFVSNFGRAANCFGREHVDEILSTHQKIQKAIFDGEDVVRRLKTMIEERFGVRGVPDGFLFFPVELGGLDLQSPFIFPLQIRHRVAKNRSRILDQFQTDEKERYHELKAEFDRGRDHSTRKDVEGPDWKPAEGADTFMPFEEYSAYREEYCTAYEEDHLVTAFDELLQKPVEQQLANPTPAVKSALEELQGRSHDPKGITGHWDDMEPYWKWVAELYGPEMIERFGGLSVVEAGLLPIGMVGLFRDQKVKWHG